MSGEGETPTARPRSWLLILAVGRNPRWTLVRILVFVVTCFILFKFVFFPIQVVGVSMLPTHVHGQINFINKLAYRKSKPQRGDIVAVRMAGENALLLKRVIGLPGEHVSIERGIVFINGKPLEEDYVKSRRHPSWQNDKTLLAPNQYVVIGDNRSMPMDAHTYGIAYEHQIVGRIVLRKGFTWSLPSLF